MAMVFVYIIYTRRVLVLFCLSSRLITHSSFPSLHVSMRDRVNGYNLSISEHVYFSTNQLRESRHTPAALRCNNYQIPT